jgi:hypothetical protein
LGIEHVGDEHLHLHAAAIQPGITVR